MSRAERRRAARVAGTPFEPAPRAPTPMSRAARRAAVHAAEEEARLLGRATKFALLAGYIRPLPTPAEDEAPPDPAQVELRITYAVERAAQACATFNRREVAIIRAACERKRVKLALEAAKSTDVAP